MNEKPLSFQSDIRALFSDLDVDHMKPFGMDLSAHASVKEHAANILSAVTSGMMPPRGENRTWTREMCDMFERWMKEGCPP